MVGKVKTPNKNKNKKTTKKPLNAIHPSFASPTPSHIISSKSFGLVGMRFLTDVMQGNMRKFGRTSFLILRDKKYARSSSTLGQYSCMSTTGKTATPFVEADV